MAPVLPTPMLCNRYLSIKSFACPKNVLTFSILVSYILLVVVFT